MSGDELDCADFLLSHWDDDKRDSAAEITASQMPTALTGTTQKSRKRSHNFCRASDESESCLKINLKSQHTKSPNQVPPRTQRIDGGTALGLFDVLAFGQRTGFFV